MPNADPFEAMYNTLFLMVSNAAPFQTFSRKWKNWDQVSDQPALFQVQKGELPSEGFTGLPLKYKLHVQEWIFAKTMSASDDDAPSTVLNPLITAVKQLIRPATPGEKQTLGGLVEHAWIDGEIRIWEGALGNQAIAMIPITILLGEPIERLVWAPVGPYSQPAFAGLQRMVFTPDGIANVFNLPVAPTGDILLFWNGLQLNPPDDYVRAGAQITTTVTPKVGDALIALYIS